MNPEWTFAQKLTVAFSLLVGLSLLIAILSIVSLRSVSRTGHEVLTQEANDLLEVHEQSKRLERRTGLARAHLLTNTEERQADIRQYRVETDQYIESLRTEWDSDQMGQLVDSFETAEKEFRAALDHVRRLQQQGVPLSEIQEAWDERVEPAHDALANAIDALATFKRDAFEIARKQSVESARRAVIGVAVLSALLLLLSAILAVLLTRAITEQLGSAIAHLQTSSTELQASASQQATTAREQASATHAVATTVRELLASSKQIAESAQRVLRIAEETDDAARRGDRVVAETQEAINAVQQQIDSIVQHSAELGAKAQQIGIILEIIDELSEQTNILAINATIEAAGAGESGRRFSVVAEEIRKLADRVGGSTRDIRSLIDEIRSATSTAAMATEQGAKAVAQGTRQFREVASAFESIAGQVENTTEAARGIELGTRQQTTAVEQVGAAFSDIAQSATEVEASSRQTVEIAGELTTLSHELARLTGSRDRMEAAR